MIDSTLDQINKSSGIYDQDNMYSSDENFIKIKNQKDQEGKDVIKIYRENYI